MTFCPISGRPSYGTSDAEGRYTLEHGLDQEGAAIGMSRVKIATGGPGAPAGPAAGIDPSKARRSRVAVVSMPPGEIMLPDQIEVIAGENTIDLVLPPQ